MRVLDLDLDFFVHGAATWREPEDDRLDPDEYPPWELDDVLEFLTKRCLLTGPLPGMVVEHHGELFGRWRDAIGQGLLTPPFSVAHVDAHADLGQGDPGYMYLLSEVLRLPVEERRFPKAAWEGLNDGNYLAFAIACRWLSDLKYVFNSEGPGRPTDILRVLMKGFAFDAPSIQLACMDRDRIQDAFWADPAEVPIEHLEPEVPFEYMPWPRFMATEPFDVVCLAHSKAWTPQLSDALFHEIRARFIDETAFRG